MPHRSIRNWATEKLEVLFGVYLTWQGVSIPLSGRSGVRSPSFHYLVELSQVVDIQPVVILSMLFFVPGVLVLLPRTRKVGLLVATMCMLIHAVGTARSIALFENGAITAPNTYAFIAILAGWLYMTEKYAR